MKSGGPIPDSSPAILRPCVYLAMTSYHIYAIALRLFDRGAEALNALAELCQQEAIKQSPQAESNAHLVLHNKGEEMTFEQDTLTYVSEQCNS